MLVEPQQTGVVETGEVTEAAAMLDPPPAGGAAGTEIATFLGLLAVPFGFWTEMVAEPETGPR